MLKVYMPYSDHLQSVAVLDDDLLWEQLDEAQLLCQALAMDAPNTKLLHVKQWRGYEGFLLLYLRRMQVECQKRGLGSWQDDQRYSPYARSWLLLGSAGKNTAPRPPRWIGGEWFLESNRSELIRLNPTHYAQRFPTTPLEMPFLFPQNTPGRFDYTVAMSRRDAEMYWEGERVIPDRFMGHLATKGIFP